MLTRSYYPYTSVVFVITASSQIHKLQSSIDSIVIVQCTLVRQNQVKCKV